MGDDLKFDLGMYSYLKQQAKPPPPHSARAARVADSLSEALADAARQLQDALGSSSIGLSTSHLRLALRLADRVDQILELVQKHPTLPDPNVRYIPRCLACGAEPGTHWSHDCPGLIGKGQDTSKLVFDYHRRRILYYKDVNDYGAAFDPRDYARATVPRCGICGKGPGAHWPDRCPDNPIADKMWGDRVVPPSECRAARETDEFQYFLETGFRPSDRNKGPDPPGEDPA